MRRTITRFLMGGLMNEFRQQDIEFVYDVIIALLKDFGDIDGALFLEDIKDRKIEDLEIVMLGIISLLLIMI